MTGRARTLEIEPLTKQAFGPFGDVIEMTGAEARLINEGTTTRFHDLAEIDVAQDGGVPSVSIFEAEPRPRPIAIRMLERHPLGTQAFFPLQERDWLVVVCEGAERPEIDTLRCFRAGGRQGVNYRRNVWHHPLLVLVPEHRFLVLDRRGAGPETEEFWLEDEGAVGPIVLWPNSDLMPVDSARDR